MSRTTLLAGGVGGARLARGLAAVVPPDQLAIVVNIGDDERIYGAHVAADLDTVMYTLAGMQGPHGWGVADDSFVVMDALSELGADTSFRLGDRDLATCLHRTEALDRGIPLSQITDELRRSLGVAPTVLPASDDAVRTRLRTREAGWLAFQDYFVRRAARDEVLEIEYAGAGGAIPAPGVVEAIEQADLVVIASSNPLLSILPILAIPAIGTAVRDHPRVVAVSPLFAGKALKGPADRVLASLGHPPGNEGVMAVYEGYIDEFVVDTGDAADAASSSGIRIHVTDTRFVEREAAIRFATWLMEV